MKSYSKLKVYGTQNCSYCTKAKEFLELNDLKYTYIALEELTDEDLHIVLNQLAPGAKTVPIILIDGKWIGGFTEMKEYLRSE